MISTAFRTSILASLAAAATAAAATDYWAITPAPATDAMNASSISGYTSADGAPVGWAAEKGSDVVAVAGITEENAVYHVWQDELVHRSPAGNQGQGVFATPSSSSIVIEDGCLWNVTSKIGNNGVLTLSNLVVKAGATFFFRTNADASTDERQTLGGTIDMAEGSLLKLNSYVHNSSKTTYLVKQATLAATVAGKGRITALRGPAVISGTGNEATANSSKAPVQWVTGDLSGFTGDLEVYGEGTQKNVWLRLMGESSIPGDPAPDELAYVIVTNAAKLRVDHDWVSPTNRVWILGSSGTPEIYVDAGKTLTINGPVVGTVGLKKTGEGTLILNDRSRLSGTITVSAGVLQRFVYITPDADGTGDGSSWASPMKLYDYLAVSGNRMNNDVIRLKTGIYNFGAPDDMTTAVTFGSINLSFEGGYAGTDATTLDPVSPMSIFQFWGRPTSQYYSMFVCNAGTGYATTFKRITFERGRSAPIFKTGAGTLTLVDCVVVSNGWRNRSGNSTSGGRGIHAESGRLFMTNCTVEYNGPHNNPTYTGNIFSDHGFGVYLKNITAELVGCTIRGNGARIDSDYTDSIEMARTIRGAGRGMGLYATGSTKLTAIDCDFIANKSTLGYYENSPSEKGRGTGDVGQGSTVALDLVTVDGSSFRNCSFLANQNVRGHSFGRYNTWFGGALNVRLSNPAHEVVIDNCTFAYNLTDSPHASAGLDVWKGVVNVSNSVFVGNHKLTSCEAGADIMVRTGAVVNVSHTLLPGTDDWHVKTEIIDEDTGTVNLRDIVVGDALLASETLASTNLIETYTKKIQSANFTCLRYGFANIDEMLAFDVHPRSKAGRWTAAGYAQDKEHSPAIDAGDPAASVGAEPKPNGRRLNLGRYGGTAEASLTFVPPGTFLMVQ